MAMLNECLLFVDGRAGFIWVCFVFLPSAQDTKGQLCNNVLDL